MRFAILLAASIATIAGCAAPASEEATTSTSNVESVAKPEAILIQQAQRIVSVKLDGGGKVVGTALNHSFFVSGDTILHTEIEHASGKTVCSFSGMEMNGEWSSTDIRVSAEKGAAEFMFVTAPPPPQDNEYGYREQRGEVTGIVGPYAFVVAQEHYMGCGAAHPSFGRTATIRDLEHAAATVTFRAPEAAAVAARAALAGKGMEGADVELVEITPHFDENARLTLTYRFEKPASHAEADGQGNDYSVSASIESTAIDAPLPEGLESLREPPAAVRAYLDANPGQGATNPIKGWSIPN